MANIVLARLGDVGRPSVSGVVLGPGTGWAEPSLSLGSVLGATAVCGVAMVVGGVGGVAVVERAGRWEPVLAVGLGGLVLAVVLVSVAVGWPHRSRVLAPAYAVVQGLLLGIIASQPVLRPAVGALAGVFVFSLAVPAVVLGVSGAPLPGAEPGGRPGAGRLLIGLGAAGFGVACGAAVAASGLTPATGRSGQLGIVTQFAAFAALTMARNLWAVEQAVAGGARTSARWYAALGLTLALVWWLLLVFVAAAVLTGIGDG